MPVRHTLFAGIVSAGVVALVAAGAAAQGQGPARGRGAAPGQANRVHGNLLQVMRGELRDAGMATYKAAQAKNQDAILEAAGVVSEACSHCHDKYREVPNRC